jgi:hypothetical protein
MRYTDPLVLITAGALAFAVSTSARSQEPSRLARPQLPADYALVDQEIQAVWKQFCAGLRSGSASAALQLVSESSRERYRGVLESLGAKITALPDNWSQPQMLSLLGGNIAEYLTKETVDGKEFVHIVVFGKSANGAWMIEQF